MDFNNYAKVLQNFYKVYIKTDCDKITGYPIDPISSDPIEPKYIIRIICRDHKNNPIKTQYFNIITLNMWFLSRGEPINPLTNLEFTKEDIQKISEVYQKRRMKAPKFINLDTTITMGASAGILNESYRLEKLLHNYSKFPNDIDKFRDLLLNNHSLININRLFFSNNYFLNFETILMSCIINDNYEALEEVLYFNPDLDKVDSRFKFKAIDLAIVSKKPNSCLMLRTLLFNGARMDIKTKKGHSGDLTNNIEKLEILNSLILSHNINGNKKNEL
jgi:hypothetical protein